MSNLDMIEVLEAKDETDQMNHIKIKDGKFKDIVYKYGRVWFPEDQPEGTLSYEYDLIEGTVAAEDMQDFSQFMGDVIIDMLRRQLGIQGSEVNE